MLAHKFAALLAAVALLLVLGVLIVMTRPIGTTSTSSTRVAPLLRDLAVRYDTLTRAIEAPLSPEPPPLPTTAALDTAIASLANELGAYRAELAAGDATALAELLSLGRDASARASEAIALRSELQRSMASLATTGPPGVRDLRAAGNALTAERAFALAVDTVAVATTGAGDDDRDRLVQEIDLLGRSAAELPAVTPLLDAASAVLEATSRFDAARTSLAALSLTAAAASVEGRLLQTGDPAREVRVWLTFSSFALLLSLALLLTVARQRGTPVVSAIADTTGRVGEADVELRLAEQLTALDEALADLELAQRGVEQSRHTEQLQQVAGEIDARMNTPLWYLRSNTALVNERLDDLQTYLEQSSETLALFAGPDTDRRRVAQGLTNLRRMLAQKGLDDSVNEVRTLLRDNAAGLDELVQDVQNIVAGLHPADPSEPTDVAALAEQCAADWNAGSPDALVTVALEGPLIVDANEPPLRRALMRTFAAVSAADATRRSAVIISAVPGNDYHIDLLIASAEASRGALAVTEPTLASGADAGLDLAIAAKLVRACGGELTAATTDGDAGTLCTITLPVLLARRAGSEKAGVDAASGTGG